MKITQFRSCLLLLAAMIAVVASASMLMNQVGAETSAQVSWVDANAPTITKQADLTAAQFQNEADTIPCQETTSREWGPAPFSPSGPNRQEHIYRGCTVPVGGGVYDVANQAIIPYGERYMQRLVSDIRPLANDYMLPAKYSGKFAVIQDAFGPSPNPQLRIVDSWQSAFQPQLSDDGYGNIVRKQAYSQDFLLRDQQGNPINVKPNGLAFSSNGEWLHALAPDRAHLLINTMTHEVTPFAPPLTSNLAQYVAISNDGRYVAMTQGQQSLKVYDVSRCSAPAGELVSRDCQAIELYSAVLRNYFGDVDFRVSHVDFVGSDDALDVNIEIVNGTSATDARYRLRLPGSTETKYLALGDSFSSGEGAYGYRKGTDFYTDAGHFNLCHQSENSYPYLLSRTMLFDWFGAVTCSGSVSKDVARLTSGDVNVYGLDGNGQQIPGRAAGFLGGDPVVSASLLPGYRPQSWFVNNLAPMVATVSIGGNDVGFGDIIQSCVGENTNCFDTAEEREGLARNIDAEVSVWTRTFSVLHSEQPSTGRLYVVGYPKIINPDGICDANVQMNRSERKFGGALVDYLNDSIRVAATRAGVAYVDVANSFVDTTTGADYRLCGDSPAKAVNGLKLITPVSGCGSQQPPGQSHCNESYHPSELGQLLLEHTIMLATNGLTTPMPQFMGAGEASATLRDQLVNSPDGSVLDVTPYNYNNLIGNVNAVIGLGEDISVGAHEITDELGDTIVRNASFFAEIHSNPVRVGTFTINDQDQLVGSITIPAGIPVGYHQLHFLIPLIDGRTYDSYEIIYVAASANDTDGDGIPNDKDPCVLTPQSGLDRDHDGIDDACDGDYTVRQSGESEQQAILGAAIRQGTITPREASLVVVGSPEDNDGSQLADGHQKEGVASKKPSLNSIGSKLAPVSKSSPETKLNFLYIVVAVLACTGVASVIIFRKLSKSRS